MKNQYFGKFPEGFGSEEMSPQTKRMIQLGLGGRLTEDQFQALQSDQWGSRFTARTHYCRNVSWSVHTVEWMAELAELIGPNQRVLEVGAGKGLLALHMPRFLKEGTTWLCTDRCPPPGARHVRKEPAMRSLKREKPDIVFASWIPYRSTLDRQIGIRAPLIQVGEGWGGCTGSEVFWGASGIRHLSVEIEQDVPQWYGMRDYTHMSEPGGKR